MSEEFYKLPKLTVNNGSIVIYYFSVSICRFPTGYSVSSEKTTKKKFKEWDYKNNCLKTFSKDYESKSKKLEELLNKSKDIVISKFQEQDIILTGKELMDILNSNYTVKKLNSTLELREHYNSFLDIKRKKYIDKPNSLKDYVSLSNLLESYEKYKNLTLFVRHLTENFIDDLIQFTKIKHPKEIERNGVIFKFKTKGQLNQNTLRKRLDNLKEFKDYLVKNEIVQPSNFIDISRKKIIIPTKKSITLTITEIHQLYDLNLETKKLNEIKDLFVFICLTGLRWSDVEQFDKRFVNIDDENWTYKLVPSKTKDSSSVECTIPLCSIVQEILNKYTDGLSSIIPTNQNFNEILKIVCQKSKLFEDITRSKKKGTNTFMYKYELITAHKGRDTFITNLIDTVPINELMKYTGHTKVSTLMKYVDKSRKVSHEYIKIFNK